MALSWLSERSLDATAAQLSSAPHPALEPISAWLFRQDSPFLETEGLSGNAASLYTMAINRDGFDPAAQDAFRAQALTSPHGRSQLGHLFSDAVLGPLLQTIERSLSDPSVYVLPLASDALLPDDELRRRAGFGPLRDSHWHPQMPAPKTIIGIIDHGINIFHERFRSNRLGSRVACAWIQGAKREGNALPFGVEWTRMQINAAIEDANGDEDALLRQIGADLERPGFHPLARQASHGTHVLDLAAGMDPVDPDADSYPIIAVTLPPEVTRETTGSMLALPYVMGLEYILDRARRLTYGLDDIPPVVINFSFGLTGGPRMGLHQLETTVEVLGQRHVQLTQTEKSPVVVVPAGNRNLARGHAQSAPGDVEFDITWHIQPADPTSNFLEVRVVAEPGSLTSLNVILTAPDDGDPIETSVPVTRENDQKDPQLLGQGNQIIGRVTAEVVTDDIALLSFALAPSDPGLTGVSSITPGDWQIKVTTPGARPLRFDAYILRDDVPHGFRDNGRQSYFNDDNYVERSADGRVIADDPVPEGRGIRRAGTLNAIATGPRAGNALWVAGAYVGPDPEGDIQPADYSATALNTGEEHIDVSARADMSRVLRGVAAAGTRSGTRTRLNGTSVAAPQLVRHLAMGHGALQPRSSSEPNQRLGAFVLHSEETD